MPVKTDREYRNIRMEEIEVRKDDDGKTVVEGYATTFDQPYELMRDKDITVMEVVDRNAFADTDMSDVIMQYDHTGHVYARRSNGTLQLEADDHGLRIRAELGGTEIGRQLYEEISGGYTNKMSFGFTVADQKRHRDGNIITRTITKIGKLFDVSAVSLPANDATEISARSISDGLIAEAKEEIRAEEERERREQQIQRIREMLKGDHTDDE